MDISLWMQQAAGCIDFAVRFLVLKISRTLVISVAVCLLILLIRAVLERVERVHLSSLYPYLKTYLWIFLLVVPFTGMIKVSETSLPIRRWLYVVLYNVTMYTPILTILYCAGIVVLLIAFLARWASLRRKIKKMELCKEFNLGRRIAVRRTPLSVTPFTTGFFRYTIVMPDCILKGCSEEEVINVIEHEYVHITRGHLVFFRLIQWCQILWFLNPLIHICARMIREDMEVICDRETIRAYGNGSAQYGMVLIKSLQLIRGQNAERTNRKVTMGFASERAFRDMKKRVGMIADYRASRTRQVRTLLVCIVLAAVSLLVFVKSISYASYTSYGDFDMFAYDENMTQVLKDRQELKDMIELCDVGLRIDNEGMKALLAKEGLDPEGDYWIYYDGYMKLPGAGGGGKVVNYYPGQLQEKFVTLPYNDQLLANRILDFLMRHI